ncbi:hypothetical protein PNOK_0056800 [Pyrrhoderma noxium]|uniref:Monopolin complex subunit Csm1/Pcs1 C-terminal domain-containing protein n=1 Tax=Pyrrhoderma noxium TaxID=2282107 RepID=A0A286UV64_9AGAM|nr:hypothetical protein PNOK_0056800 [Pyrrhoderma noxium]
MSDDELGFNPYGASDSPFRIQKYVEPPQNKALKPKQVATANSNGAGPSKKPPSKTLARQMARKRSPSPPPPNPPPPNPIREDEAEERSVDANDGEMRPVGERKTTQSRRAPEHAPKSKPGPGPKGRGKGKGKANVEKDAEAMDIDNTEDATAEDAREEEEEVVEVSKPTAGAGAAALRRPFKLNAHQENASWKKREERHKKELERYEKQLKEVKGQRDHFAKQIQEVFQMRNTEAENNLEQQRALYESRLQTSEEMIRELTSQLSRVDSLTREGKTSTLHFLTREAADEERRGVERQVEQLKAKLKEKDLIIAEREATISDKDAELNVLEVQLKAEIDRSKQLAARPNNKDIVGKGRMPNRADTRLEGLKQSNAYRLYEDMTNILFLDCRCELAGDADDEQWVYNCVYSADGKTSLSFSLRTYNEPGEDGVSVPKVAYSPGIMSDNSQEFMDRLDFLADEFTFQRKQLDVFLDKVYTTLNDPQDAGV